jgi:hypothetical protein
MSDEPRWPAIHITRTFEEEGRTIQEPVTSPVCDFCGHDSPAWDYDCHDFVTDCGASTDGWAACTPCSDMIEADDWEGVYFRSASAGRKYGLHSPWMLTCIRLMHAGFREHRYGERRPWG